MYNGQIVNPDSYYVAEHSTIIAYKGTPWPPGNLEVTYTYGGQIPVAGQMAAKLFAIELIKSFEGDDCALPDRVTSISRQGVSYTILDNQDFLENMRTGIYAIDLFLKTANPSKALAPAKVFSTDIPRPRRAAPARPKVLSVSATYDVSLNKTNSFVVSKTIACTGANAALAGYNSASYTLRLETSSWNGYTVKSYDATNSVFRVTAGTTFIDLEFDYKTTYDALGPNDPGTWTLSAVDTSNASIELLQANIEIDKVTSSQIDAAVTYTNTPVKLVCKQGETFARTVTWKSSDVLVDLTGYTAAMQVRSAYSSTSATLSLVSTAGAAKTVTAAVVASNVATITTSAAHGYIAGSTVTLFNLTASSGSVQYLVRSAPTTTTFTIAYTATSGSLTLGASPTATLTAGLTLGGAAGTISISISATNTAAITAGNYVYDLELTSGTTVTRLLEGQFYVSPEVTT